jgi:hypothetical protein
LFLSFEFPFLLDDQQSNEVVCWQECVPLATVWSSEDQWRFTGPAGFARLVNGLPGLPAIRAFDFD